MVQDEETCGQELAASAAVPAQFGSLFRHVATNLRAHAGLVGGDTDAAQREHDALLRVAGGYEEVAGAAERIAEFMRTLAGLEPVAHDFSKMDRHAFVAWMKRKVELQRQLAETLLQHAEQSERVLEELGAERAT